MSALKLVNKEHEKLVTQIQKTVYDEIQEEEEGIFRHDRIVDALHEWEGKKISERVIARIQKGLPNHTMYLKKIGSLIQVCIWRKSSNDDMTTHLLAYDSNPLYFVGSSFDQGSGFRYWDNSHGDAARKRNVERNAFMKSHRMNQIADAMLLKAKVDAELETLLDNSECRYNLRKIQETL